MENKGKDFKEFFFFHSLYFYYYTPNKQFFITLHIQLFFYIHKRSDEI